MKLPTSMSSYRPEQGSDSPNSELTAIGELFGKAPNTNVAEVQAYAI